MGFDACHAVERAAIFEADGSAGGSGEVNDFLETMTARAAGNDDAFEGAPGAQGLGYRMNAYQDCQSSIIP
jgi:hypothetical protein